MGDPRTEEGKDSPFIAKIRARAEEASPKVKTRVMEKTLPNLQSMAAMGPSRLEMWRNDFLNLAEDPKDESGFGQYDDWTPDDIRELYAVLYGEEME